MFEIHLVQSIFLCSFQHLSKIFDECINTLYTVILVTLQSSGLREHNIVQIYTGVLLHQEWNGIVYEIDFTTTTRLPSPQKTVVGQLRPLVLFNPFLRGITVQVRARGPRRFFNFLLSFARILRRRQATGGHHRETE